VSKYFSAVKSDYFIIKVVAQFKQAMGINVILVYHKIENPVKEGQLLSQSKKYNAFCLLSAAK
jgi:hypothetical protein